MEKILSGRMLSHKHISTHSNTHAAGIFVHTGACMCFLLVSLFTSIARHLKIRSSRYSPKYHRITAHSCTGACSDVEVDAAVLRTSAVVA